MSQEKQLHQQTCVDGAKRGRDVRGEQPPHRVIRNQITNLALMLHRWWEGQPVPLLSPPPQLPAPAASPVPVLLPLLPQGRNDSLIPVKTVSRKKEKGAKEVD